MNNREQFESAWHKEYPLHSSTAFTRSGFDPERYANTRVQDGWLMWQAARATPADQEPIGWEYYEEGKLFKTYDSADKADHAKKMFGGVVRPIFAPADHSSIIRMLEGYAESYEMMARQGKDATVRCSSVAVDIRQNMAKWVRDRATPADHIGDAAEKVDAQSVPVADPEGWQLVPTEATDDMIHAVMLPGPWYRFKTPGLEVSYRLMVAAAPQSPQKVSDSVRDAVIEECAKEADKLSVKYWDDYKRGKGPERANPYFEGKSDGAEDSADAIRGLKSAPPQKPVSE